MSEINFKIDLGKKAKESKGLTKGDLENLKDLKNKKVDIKISNGMKIKIALLLGLLKRMIPKKIEYNSKEKRLIIE